MKKSADHYSDETTERVRSTCLYLATRLGDLADDLVIVGGLVPSLLPLETDHVRDEGHIGTTDFDLGLSLGVLETGRYADLADRLTAAGFSPDRNEQGNEARQRWAMDVGTNGKVTVDLLIDGDIAEGGRLRNLQGNLAAVIAPGLRLAFEDYATVEIEGITLLGERASRSVRVAGAAAFAVLKLLAFGNRGEDKDAYDLYYVLRHHPDGAEGIARRLMEFDEPELLAHARSVLSSDFATMDHTGPVRVAAFLLGDRNDELQADVAGVAAELLEGWR